MNPDLQGKLLRVLQEKEFERVGSSETLRVDVRVLASSNRDMEKAIADGVFRHDLYYRLNVVGVELPPLRERREDIRPLTEYFVEKYNREEGSRVKVIGAETARLLENYDFPGNVRELENIVERAIVLGRGEELSPTVIAQSVKNPFAKASDITAAALATSPAPTPPATAAPTSGAAAVVPAVTAPFQPEPLDHIERDYVRKVVDYFAGHRLKAAEALEISERSLRDRLKRWSEIGGGAAN
jgi:DNA-binding NtrC family response regulator